MKDLLISPIDLPAIVFSLHPTQ